MESQFALANITVAMTKFHHVVSALQPEELCLVGDLIKKPPTQDPEDPYKTLKNLLCTQYQDTEEERLRELISGLQLGDRKPSRLLLEIKSKAGDRLSDDLLKSLFLQRLPTHVQQILAISKDTVDKLAEMADGIMSASASSTAIQAVSSIVFTTQSTVQCIQYLLQNGYHYVLTRAFNSDPVESFFSALRQMNGGNDLMDVRAAVCSLEKILKTGIVIRKKNSNVGESNYNLLSKSTLIKATEKTQIEEINEVPEFVVDRLCLLDSADGW